MLSLLSYLITAVSLVCWILVLVKVFQSGNTMMGVLSICPLVAFIYGWMKNTELGIQKIMLAWTAVIVLNVILSVVVFSTMSHVGTGVQ